MGIYILSMYSGVFYLIYILQFNEQATSYRHLVCIFFVVDLSLVVAYNQSTLPHYLGVPGVLVSAIVGSSFDTYFSDKMCWVSMDKFWLFTGPPLAMIAVSAK